MHEHDIKTLEPRSFGGRNTGYCINVKKNEISREPMGAVSALTAVELSRPARDEKAAMAKKPARDCRKMYATETCRAHT